jgi:hypothetical protein
LKTEKKDAAIEAICCYSDWCPCFGRDMGVVDQCNAHHQSIIELGSSYTNDTGLHGEAVFTGRWNFQVTEIEVFEIRD